MNFLEYKNSGNHTYKEFAAVVQNILMQALDGLNFHVIRARAKSASSLEKKEEIDSIENLEEEFADLAGCRIIFYFNKDVDHFNNSGIIEQNFEVVGRKVHYQSSPDDKRYTGFHKIVKLNQDRLKLPEYKKYEGLLCEIQIHTIIDHAFSETSHDILYKKPKLDNIRKEKWEKLEKKFHRFHDDYIKKAGYELQSIKDEFERIVAGQNVYSLSCPILKTRDINNNERYDHLRNLISYGIEVCEFVPDEIKEIINTSIDCAKSTEVVPIITHYGESRGRDFTDIALLCLQVIEYFRYGFLDFTLDQCLNFSCHQNEEISKASDRILELISRYDLKLLEEHGLAPQLQIMKFLESLSEENLKKFYKSISELCKRMLSTEADHSDYGDYRKVVYTTGAINSHENLIKLRQRVISLLEKLYDDCTDPKVKIQSIIPALIASTKLPISNPYNNQLLLDILRDCRRLARFFLGKLESEKKDVLQNIEHNFRFLYHFSKDVASKTMRQNCCKSLKP